MAHTCEVRLRVRWHRLSELMTAYFGWVLVKPCVRHPLDQRSAVYLGRDYTKVEA